MKKLILFSLIFCFLLSGVNIVLAQEEKIEVNFFYSVTCTHCAKQKIFLDSLEKKYPEIEIKRFEISANVELLKDFYEKYKVPQEAWGSVPVIFTQDRYFLGYSESQNKEIENCVLGLIKEQEQGSCGCEDPSKTIELPIIGKINVADYSLPVLAIILGFLDGFNVCSLGALILILALVLSLKSRKKILVFGGIFILTTSIVYGLLIIIWYKIFSLLAPYLEWMRLFIGCLGIIGGFYFLREFIKFRKKGAVCEMDTGKKVTTKFSAIFNKYLKESKNILLILALIFVFAGVITVLEFPCSSVVPLFFAGILANSELSSFSYLFYIILFIVFYMIDEIIVFLVAFFTMSLWLASGKFVTLFALIQAIVLFVLGIYYLVGF